MSLPQVWIAEAASVVVDDYDQVTVLHNQWTYAYRPHPYTDPMAAPIEDALDQVRGAKAVDALDGISRPYRLRNPWTDAIVMLP